MQRFWIKTVQQAHFSFEIKALLEGRDLPKSNALLKLTPRLDLNGLLRVGGRLERSFLPDCAKHPYILPKDSIFSSLIIADAHNRTLHGEFRQQRAQQLMGQLPTERVTPSRHFDHVGVDYAGPFIIKTWRGKNAKTLAYVVLFVCFSTSAIHLELVTDYTTEAFIAAFKRFTSRREICSTLYSDCGTNLKGMLMLSFANSFLPALTRTET
ncbi:uncharacterized protein LOC143898864 [Temnothorax americanus]|uniref:uncharacterized protein LOC143898864 n=1 Tax=Temnothorax americanus TaxID=1964332 RepID=UPI0040687288